MPIGLIRSSMYLGPNYYPCSFFANDNGRISTPKRRVDVLDRGEFPPNGSGNVFIGHGTVTYQGKLLNPNGVYYDKECRSLYHSPYLFGDLQGSAGGYFEWSNLHWRFFWEGTVFHFEAYGGYRSYGHHYVYDAVTEQQSAFMGPEIYSYSHLEDQELTPGVEYLTICWTPRGNLQLMSDDEVTSILDDLRTCFSLRDLTGRFVDGRDNVGFTEAYYAAMDNLPQMATNNIANIAAITDILRGLLGLVRGDGLTLVDTFRGLTKEAWLAWRYEYSTSVQDIREITDYAFKLADALDRGFEDATVAGAYHIGNSVYRFSCKVAWKSLMPENIKELLSNKHALERAGLSLNLENVWDMIPYSFIVDWFIPVGDWLHKICVRDGALDLELKDGWYSKSGHEEEEEYIIDYYVRFASAGHNPNVPTFRVKGSKGTTWCFRAMDAVALCT